MKKMEKKVIWILISQELHTDQGVLPLKLKNWMLKVKWNPKLRQLLSWRIFLILKIRIRTEKEEEEGA